MTLAEHLQRISPLGGQARIEGMSPEDLTVFTSAGGKAGGKARAQKLTAKQRSAIAQKAAQARWGPKRTKTKKKVR